MRVPWFFKGFTRPIAFSIQEPIQENFLDQNEALLSYHNKELDLCFTGAILASHLNSTDAISKHYAYIIVILICYIVVILICVFVSSFAWSWGPLGWLIPSEIFPLETRTTGFFFAVSTNMICTFIIAQAFLTMLCHMRSSIFFFFASWIVIMRSFAAFFLPETKGIPIDEMNERAWKKHWFWHRFFRPGEDESCLENELKFQVTKKDA